MGRRGGWDARVSANGVDRGEIFTRVKASTRGRELSRHGAKLILPAAEGGGEGCAHAWDAPLPVHEEFPSSPIFPSLRMTTGVVKVNGVKLMNFEEKLDSFSFFFYFYLLEWE